MSAIVEPERKITVEVSTDSSVTDAEWLDAATVPRPPPRSEGIRAFADHLDQILWRINQYFPHINGPAYRRLRRALAARGPITTTLDELVWGGTHLVVDLRPSWPVGQDFRVVVGSKTRQTVAYLATETSRHKAVESVHARRAMMGDAAGSDVYAIKKVQPEPHRWAFSFRVPRIQGHEQKLLKTTTDHVRVVSHGMLELVAESDVATLDDGKTLAQAEDFWYGPIQEALDAPFVSLSGDEAEPVVVPPRRRVSTVLQMPDLNIDLFSGMGGASKGFELAVGVPMSYAINHEPDAVILHFLNNRRVTHLSQNAWIVDPASVVAGRNVGLLWASPDCVHFSRAKAGRPLDKKARELAWAVYNWVRVVRPRVVILENVKEFLTWGPLNREGKPIKKRAGEYFWNFVNKLKRLQYKVEWEFITATDFGAATLRERVFFVIRRDGEPTIWPTTSHGPGRWEPFKPFTECVDWSVLGQDVYRRSKPLAASTLSRIETGIQWFVLGPEGPSYVHRDSNGGLYAAFIAQHNEGQVGHEINAPLPTTTTRDSHAIVTVELIPSGGKKKSDVVYEKAQYRLGTVRHRMLEPVEHACAMSFTEGTVLLGTKEQQHAAIGNAVALVVAKELITANFEPRVGATPLRERNPSAPTPPPPGYVPWDVGDGMIYAPGPAR